MTRGFPEPRSRATVPTSQLMTGLIGAGRAVDAQDVGAGTPRCGWEPLAKGLEHSGLRCCAHCEVLSQRAVTVILLCPPLPALAKQEVPSTSRVSLDTHAMYILSPSPHTSGEAATAESGLALPPITVVLAHQLSQISKPSKCLEHFCKHTTSSSGF